MTATTGLFSDPHTNCFEAYRGICLGKRRRNAFHRVLANDSFNVLLRKPTRGHFIRASRSKIKSLNVEFKSLMLLLATGRPGVPTTVRGQPERNGPRFVFHVGPNVDRKNFNVLSRPKRKSLRRTNSRTKGQIWLCFVFFCNEFYSETPLETPGTKFDSYAFSAIRN